MAICDFGTRKTRITELFCIVKRPVSGAADVLQRREPVRFLISFSSGFVRIHPGSSEFTRILNGMNSPRLVRIYPDSQRDEFTQARLNLPGLIRAYPASSVSHWILPESVFHGIVILVGAYILVCGTDDLAVIDDLFNTVRAPA